MTNQDKQHYIYLRSTHERIPCTKEEFDNYYRDINTYRKAQQRHGKCVCPEKKRLDCDMDCATCPFRRAGDTVSLDYTVSDENGEEITWGNSLESMSPAIDDIVADSERMAELFERLKKLMPQALEIGRLRQQGIPDVQIARQIGIHRNTFGSRLQRVKEILLTAEEKSKYFVKFNLDGLLRGDYQSRMNGYAIGRQNGWMSANDIRELENLDRIPAESGGDLYLINGNMLPLSNAGAFANITPSTQGKEEETNEEILEVDEPGTDGDNAGEQDTLSQRHNRRGKLV